MKKNTQDSICLSSTTFLADKMAKMHVSLLQQPLNHQECFKIVQDQGQNMEW